ncbi:hypothetical protein NYW84_10485 [Acinetobacter junii]|uniref:hypothetical protein n=1 Tax=Acinetobacter junii TaxID=40215 RepID=UPI002DBAA043|nr:hypothetical protein [Acinetobacter junii]MEB8381463.1 hypothetical protein [Acinetobacter junii]
MTQLPNEPVIEVQKPTLEKQIELLDQIREKILENPEHFNMSSWHSHCGTSHCIAGWAQVLTTQEINSSTAEDVGRELLPDFANFFYGRTGYLRKWFEARAYTLKHGEVAKSGNVWVDAECNFYDGNLEQEEAEEQAASNNNCMYCSDCSGCSGEVFKTGN